MPKREFVKMAKPVKEAGADVAKAKAKPNTIADVVKTTRAPVEDSEAIQRGRIAQGAPLVGAFQVRKSRVPTKEQVDAAGGGVIGFLRAARALNGE